MPRRILHITLVLLCTATIAVARAGSVPTPDDFRTTAEHIPTPKHGAVSGILRDARGFLWFGTTRGLCRYDGYQVRRIPGANRDLDFVLSVIDLGNDALLVGTAGGLLTFDTRNERFTPVATEFGGRITALVRENEETIWIGTAGSGLLQYDASDGTLRSAGFTEANRMITALFLDSRGALWVANSGGHLAAFEPATGRRAQAHRFSVDHVTSLNEGPDGVIWVGTTSGIELLTVESGATETLQLPARVPQRIGAIVRQDVAGGSDPTMWIAASDLGLLRYSAGGITRIGGPDAPRSFSSVHSIFLDTSDAVRPAIQVWAGTRQGVEKVLLRRSIFRNHHRDADGLDLDHGAVTSLCETADSIVWTGLWGGGLNGFRRSASGFTRVHRLLPGQDVTNLMEDRSGALWIGTSKGLWVLDRDRSRVKAHHSVDGDTTSLPSDHITGIGADSTGNVWICTMLGLSRYVPGHGAGFENFLHRPDDGRRAGGTHVSAFLQDSRGTRWVTTYGPGLIRLNPDGPGERFPYPADSSGDRENFMSTICEGGEGFLWISTRGGLLKFDPAAGAFEKFDVGELEDVHVHGIENGEGGTLLLSTATGLAGYDPRTRAVRWFDQSNGLAFREAFSGFVRDRRGKTMLGGGDGFAVFDLRDLDPQGDAPAVGFTGLRVFDRDLPASEWVDGRMRLAHDQNFFSVTFAAFDYLNPSGNKFAYRMIGLDDRWIDAGTRNFANFTHLDPGDYVLQVRGGNSENIWNPEPASLAITVVPPFWGTWWFRIAAAVFLIGSVYAAYRYRVRSLLAVERLRLRIADDLHDDIGSNLGSIALASRSAGRDPGLTESTRRKLSEIYETAITTSEGMKDIVWFIKPKSDTLDDLLLRMRETAEALLADIGHEFRVEGVDGLARVSIDFKRNVFLAFKEMLTNVVRHSSAGKVVIGVRREDGMLVMRVQDDGIGFRPEPAGGEGRGNGLSSLRRRARALGGECRIVSAPGAGTTVTFSGEL